MVNLYKWNHIKSCVWLLQLYIMFTRFFCGVAHSCRWFLLSSLLSTALWIFHSVSVLHYFLPLDFYFVLCGSSVFILSSVLLHLVNGNSTSQYSIEDFIIICKMLGIEIDIWQIFFSLCISQHFKHLKPTWIICMKSLNSSDPYFFFIRLTF